MKDKEAQLRRYASKMRRRRMRRITAEAIEGANNILMPAHSCIELKQPRRKDLTSSITPRSNVTIKTVKDSFKAKQ